MKIQNKFVLAAVLGLGVTSAFAQSSIQCFKSGDGIYQAALVWQNTLGARRANGMCQAQADAMAKRAQEQIATTAGDATAHQPVAATSRIPIDQSMSVGEYVITSKTHQAHASGGDFIPMASVAPASAEVKADYQVMWR